MIINAICGRYYREGEVPAVAPPLSAARQAKAQVVFPPQAWGEGFVKSRFRGLTQIGDEMPCNVMADEILTPGKGQIRALFCVGGNPMIAFPNQEKVSRALEDLPLLVAIDPWLFSDLTSSTLHPRTQSRLRERGTLPCWVKCTLKNLTHIILKRSLKPRVTRLRSGNFFGTLQSV